MTRRMNGGWIPCRHTDGAARSALMPCPSALPPHASCAPFLEASYTDGKSASEGWVPLLEFPSCLLIAATCSSPRRHMMGDVRERGGVRRGVVSSKRSMQSRWTHLCLPAWPHYSVASARNRDSSGSRDRPHDRPGESSSS